METTLVDLFRNTLGSLDQVWQQIGFSSRERNEQLDSLLLEVSELLRNKVEQENTLLQTYRENIADMENKISVCTDRLDMVVAPQELLLSLDSQSSPPSLVVHLSKLKQEYEVLEATCSRMEAKMSAKLHEWTTYALQLQHPHQPQPLASYKLTTANLDYISNQAGLLKTERDTREEKLRVALEELLALKVCLEKHDDSTSPSWDDLSPLYLQHIIEQTEDLKQEKMVQSHKVNLLTREISALWDRLEVTTPERNVFFAQLGEFLGPNAVLQCQTKVDELHQLLKTKMSSLIAHLRDKSMKKFSELGLIKTLSEADPEFALMHEEIKVENFARCECILQGLQDLQSVLDGKLAALKPIRTGLDKFFALCEERTVYETLIQDSGRLLSRNKRNSGLPSLQEEERMRQRVSQIPKFVAQLKQAIQEFEENCNGGVKLRIGFETTHVSTVEGITQVEEDHAQKLLRERQQRKNLTLSTSTTPSSLVDRKKKAITSGTVGASSITPLRNKN